MRNYVIITGASRGIGRASALLFAKKGYSVVAAARNEQNLMSLQEEIDKIGASMPHSEDRPRCLTYHGDIGDEAFVDQLFASLPRNAHLSALVNNAGISIIGLLQDMTLKEWNRIFQTNVTGMFLTCRRVIPLYLAQGGGSIVNVSSVWGNVGASCETAYSATKGAVNSFTRALARELAPSGIRVNAAAFGTIDTEMNHFLTGEDRQALKEEIGMGRFGTPEEAAALIVDLALNNPYLTGQVVTMDGGWI